MTFGPVGAGADRVELEACAELAPLSLVIATAAGPHADALASQIATLAYSTAKIAW